MRNIFALAMLLAAAFFAAAPAKAMTAQEFWIAEFKKAEPKRHHTQNLARRLERTATRAVRQTVRQLEPRQIERNTKQILRAPLEGLNDATNWILHRVGTNPTKFSCLGCGRTVRQAAIASGYKDCAAGDHVNGWLTPICSTPARAEVNALRITSRHISVVVEGPGGSCGPHAVKTVSGNSAPGNRIAPPLCEPLHGAHYRHLIRATGQGDGPFFMQRDPCGRIPA